MIEGQNPKVFLRLLLAEAISTSARKARGPTIRVCQHAFHGSSGGEENGIVDSDRGKRCSHALKESPHSTLCKSLQCNPTGL